MLSRDAEQVLSDRFTNAVSRRSETSLLEKSVRELYSF